MDHYGKQAMLAPMGVWGDGVRNWAFWDWISFGGLGLSAFFIALNAALKDAPNLRARLPRPLADPVWPYLPIGFFVLATTVFLAREVGLIGDQQHVARQETAARPEKSPVEPVTDQRPSVDLPPSVDAPKQASKAAERVFVGATATPNFLTSKFATLTGAEAPSFVEPYIGKWMRLSGRVGYITKPGKTIGLSFEDEPKAFMLFEKSWLEQLRILKQGDQITVVGMIYDISWVGVALKDCEIVDSGK